MPGTQRRPSASVMERLCEASYRFEFFQAVRLLARHFTQQQPAPLIHIVGERIRFGNSLNIGFAPSEIEALHLEHEQQEAPVPVWPAAAAPVDLQKITTARLIPSFIGLTGNNGTLPRSYTEHLIGREVTQRDRAARAFLDIFSNRAVTLFYRAWEKHRLHFQYERQRRERFLPMLLALAGVPEASQEPLCDTTRPLLAETLAYYAGALRQSARPAHLIERIVSEHFSVPVRLRQFTGRWYAFPPEQQTALGLSNATLGRDTVCGARMWQCQTSITLELGPLPRAQFERFLPGGEAARALSQLVILLAGRTLDCTVRPILRHQDMRPTQLGGASGARIGHNTWMVTRLTTQDRADVSWDIDTDSQADSPASCPQH